MKLRQLVIAALVAAPLALAAPAAASPSSTVDCSPCAKGPGVVAPADAPQSPEIIGGELSGSWEKTFAGDPWGKFFGDNKHGNPLGGSWEKAFQNAPMA